MKNFCKHKIICLSLIMAFLVSSLPVLNVCAEEKVNDNGISPVSSTSITTKESGNKIIYGDLNNDGEVDSGDYMTLRALMLNKITMKPEWEEIADLNYDGFIDSADYTLLRRYLLEIIQELPHRPENISPTPTKTVTTLTPTVTPTPIVETTYAAVGSKIIIKQLQHGPVPPETPNMNDWTYKFYGGRTVEFVETYHESIPYLADVSYKVWVFKSIEPGYARIEFKNYDGSEIRDYNILSYEKQLVTPSPVDIDTTVGETFSIRKMIPFHDAKIWQISCDSPYVELINEKNVDYDCSSGWYVGHIWEFKARKAGSCVITCKSEILGEIDTYNVNITDTLAPTTTDTKPDVKP